jgi:hypothetical protein
MDDEYDIWYILLGRIRMHIRVCYHVGRIR